MRTLRLTTVDAYVAFDFECPTSAGGTRLAPDVTERETQLLARAMTYKFAVLGVNYGGAKATIRATDAEREPAIKNYCAEIRPTSGRGPRTSALSRVTKRRASCIRFTRA